MTRIDFPFEARSTCFTVLSRATPRLKTGTLCETLYVHDMALYESGSASEKCMLLSLPDARSAIVPAPRVLFLVSLAIRNDCDWGCFCVGRHFIAIDVLLPESATFDTLWLYDFSLSTASGATQPDDCALEPTKVLAKKIAACGLADDEGSDVYSLVHLLSILGGSNGRHGGAFPRFLKRREIRRKAKLQGVVSEEEYNDEEDQFEGYFDLPARKGVTRLPTEAGWGFDVDNEGRTGLQDGCEPIRPRLHDWLPCIDRSSLASARRSVSERYTTDVFAENDAQFEAECAADEAAMEVAE